MQASLTAAPAPQPRAEDPGLFPERPSKRVPIAMAHGLDA